MFLLCVLKLLPNNAVYAVQVHQQFIDIHKATNDSTYFQLVNFNSEVLTLYSSLYLSFWALLEWMMSFDEFCRSLSGSRV